jgi:hypothetical protein
VAERLAKDGPTALDVTDEQTRHRAVASTLAVSLDRLTLAERELYRFRIWQLDTGQCLTSLRAEARLTACCWTTTTSIAIAGDAGVYHLTLVTNPT